MICWMWYFQNVTAMAMLNPATTMKICTMQGWTRVYKDLEEYATSVNTIQRGRNVNRAYNGSIRIQPCNWMILKFASLVIASQMVRRMKACVIKQRTKKKVWWLVNVTARHSRMAPGVPSAKTVIGISRQKIRTAVKVLEWCKFSSLLISFIWSTYFHHLYHNLFYTIHRV